ncbi:MAG TPA: pyruvate:ferredoxin (flavodoxin) oxidoreductase [Spirochaetia bacterium]|nr:pyruvate:ferredoxin (flavodoxin) oxidoreductase [Spirochaetia bacterium]
MARKMVTIDGNTAAATVAHATNEVIAIYPITPSSTMGESADEFSAEGRKNIWGTVPTVVEMQSEAGAAGAVHGALTTGALTTTFTASQGLLLMIPNMYKIAGELCSTVFHIAARAIATHALSIFGDHSDVMGCRATGWAMLCSNNAQEIMDQALIAQAATLESRVPFLHFFDGFRSYMEVQKIEQLSDEDMHALVTDELVAAHRARALNPEKPTIKGTSQNPDVYFAGRETVNRFYDAVPDIVQKTMDTFAKVVGRQYKLFDYVGAPDAERVIVMMGNGAETAEEVVRYLLAKGEKVGVLKVRLYRPFSLKHFAAALPRSATRIAVLDRTKEPGSLGEPLYEDVRTAIGEAMASGLFAVKGYPVVVGGRYGLGSYEFTGAMAKSVFDNLKEKEPKNHFTVGIHDDVMNTSLPFDPSFSSEPAGVHRAVFYGLGADGTIGANKNSIKIIGKATDNYVQGYFVLDSKKSGSTTESHLRFGKDPIKSTYLIYKANFLACHKFTFLERLDMLAKADDGAVFLLNSPFGKDEVWSKIPVEVQKQIISKKLRFYVINATKIADEVGLRGRINVTMQTAFFQISGIVPEAKALELIKLAIEDTYGNKGRDVVEMNMKAVELARTRIEKVDYPSQTTGDLHMLPPVPPQAPEFVREVTAAIIAGKGETIPVSKLPVDGTWPTGTTKWEKRSIAEEIPVWDSETCIQCGDCSLACPHGVIRMKVYDPALLASAPAAFKNVDARGTEFKGMKFSLQVSALDCTGCGVCVSMCSSFKKVNGEKTDKKAINMSPQLPLREQEAKNWEFFLSIPEVDPKLVKRNTLKGSQFIKPLFEFSGACAGCGETPYVKLMSQLFGDRAVIANATGCTSIYGGNLPTTPYTTRADGRGPTWSNSLFEDAAEFGFGMRLTSDKMFEFANELLDALLSGGKSSVPQALLLALRGADQSTQEGIEAQRGRVAELKKALARPASPEEKRLLAAADHLIKKSVWILGGDGWAYDIGYGGLDHVIASDRKVNILVLDTEVYSNTGGQMSKSTPVGAIAKFAAGGKPLAKKDLGMMAMAYGSVYVARVAFGANRAQTVRAFNEADEYPGPSLIIAYAHCINHGLDLRKGISQQKLAVDSGAWTLFRYNPLLKAQGKNPLQLDSKEPTADIADYMYNEIRFRALKAAGPERAAQLLEVARRDAKERYAFYKYLADRPGTGA